MFILYQTNKEMTNRKAKTKSTKAEILYFDLDYQYDDESKLYESNTKLKKIIIKDHIWLSRLGV